MYSFTTSVILFFSTVLIIWPPEKHPSVRRKQVKDGFLFCKIFSLIFSILQMLSQTGKYEKREK